jgi:DNA adenine methylase
MPEANSPLRYPGGKAVLTDFIAATIEANGIRECVYAEPYAGGAGAAINLLLSGKVERIILNDADRNIWAFWKSILDHTDDFLDLVNEAQLTVKEWILQREIYETPKGRSTLERGFAAFYLNRCNRSGILTNGGVIGGLNQEGKWKIDARFNRDGLTRRIERIAAFREQIEVANQDAVQFLRDHVLSKADRSRFFVYLDPPYFVKGSRLYLNYYQPSDHAVLANFLKRIEHVKWLVTYDNAPEIRKLYDWCSIVDFNLRYSAHSSKQGSEIVICEESLVLPAAGLPQLITTQVAC